MKMTKKDQNALMTEFASLFGTGHLKHLKDRGQDVVECKRSGATFIDADGEPFIDCISGRGIFNLGRRPEKIIAAFKIAMLETDQGNFPMISKEKAALGEKLAGFVPGNMECTMYSVTRGEAFDFACKLSRGALSRKGLVALEGSWFGQTGFALTLSTRKDKDDFAPLMPECELLPFGDSEKIREKINRDTAAVFIEPLQAENHCREPQPEYLEAILRRCRETGALLVMDETQTGMGRTGRKFAYEHFGVHPDILIIGESLGAGIFPIAATIFPQSLNAFLNEHPLIHLSTFGGSDLGCTVGAAALDEYARTKPWENAAKIGAHLMDGLEKAAAGSKEIISVAGRGLLLSLELKTPAKARAFCKALSRQKILADTGAVAENTVVLRPSLTLSKKEADVIVAAVKDLVKSK